VTEHSVLQRSGTEMANVKSRFLRVRKSLENGPFVVSFPEGTQPASGLIRSAIPSHGRPAGTGQPWATSPNPSGLVITHIFLV
jgi:hypothetical protein